MLLQLDALSRITLLFKHVSEQVEHGLVRLASYFIVTLAIATK